jgi:hypothetical protein
MKQCCFSAAGAAKDEKHFAWPNIQVRKRKSWPVGVVERKVFGLQHFLDATKLSC